MRPKLKLLIPLALALGGWSLFGSIAGAADPSLEARIDSARSEASQITERIATQSARVTQLRQRAENARSREAELVAQLHASTARSSELNGELLTAERELTVVRERYKGAVGVLADRLVEIYKGSEPDALSVVLEADGFDQLSARSEYLDALTDADNRIAERVSVLHEQLAGAYEEIAGVKTEVDQQARVLDASRAEIALIRAEAERSATAIAAAKAEEESALSELQARISSWELEVRREAAEQLEGAGEAFLGGPYSIPTYIVICESGGNYRALNPSSGAGGAYQILPSTWRAYGGSGLPHLASKAEQDRIAAIIWRQDGPGAWSCA